jgi:SH3-like domain-containing protein
MEINTGAINKFEEKSTKSKRKVMSKAISKLESMNVKLVEESKEFTNIVKTMMKKYDEKLHHCQTEFNNMFNKLINKTIPI